MPTSLASTVPTTVLFESVVIRVAVYYEWPIYEFVSRHTNTLSLTNVELWEALYVSGSGVSLDRSKVSTRDTQHIAAP